MGWLPPVPQALTDPLGGSLTPPKAAASPWPAPTRRPAPCSQPGPGVGAGDSWEAVESEPGEIPFLSLLMPHPLMFWGVRIFFPSPGQPSDEIAPHSITLRTVRLYPEFLATSPTWFLQCCGMKTKVRETWHVRPEPSLP